MKIPIRKVSLCVILFLLFSVSYSQQFTFKVLAFSGKVEYRLNSDYSWLKIKTGENLKNDAQLKLNKESYAALVYSDGRTLEISDEGIFDIKELEKNIQASKISVTQKFANFVAEEIIVDKAKGKTMKEFAAVVRVKPFHIETAFPSHTFVLETEIEISWYKPASSKSYVVSILNSENAPIFMDLVDDTLFILDTEELKLNRESEYKWFVSDAENQKISSDTNTISILSDASKSLILDTLNLLLTEIESNDTPLNLLSLGYFYERNGLNWNALQQFNKALSFNLQSEEYKLLFAQFLINNKLYVRISELLKEEGIVSDN